VSFIKQEMRQMPSHEPGSAGYESFHLITP